MANECQSKPSEPRNQWYIVAPIGYIYMETT